MTTSRSEIVTHAGDLFLVSIPMWPTLLAQCTTSSLSYCQHCCSMSRSSCQKLTMQVYSNGWKRGPRAQLVIFLCTSAFEHQINMKIKVHLNWMSLYHFQGPLMKSHVKTSIHFVLVLYLLQTLPPFFIFAIYRHLGVWKSVPMSLYIPKNSSIV